MVHAIMLLIFMLSVAAHLPGYIEAAEHATISEQSGQSKPEDAETAIDRAVKRVLSEQFNVDSKQLRDALGQIEAHLVKKTYWNEPEPNLKLVVEMLAETEDKSGIPVARLDALQLLASLQKIWKGTSRCNHESHTILFKNNEAILRGVQVPKSKFPARPNRMQAVLRKIALKHAQDCKLLYAKTYNQLVQDLEPDINQLIKTFFDLIVDVHIKRSKPSWSLFGGSTAKLEPSDALNAQKIIKSFKSVNGPDEVDIAYDFLKNYIQDDPDQWYLTRVPVSEKDNRLVLNETKIQQLLKRHLLEPCAKYVNLLGADVFEPVEFDALIIENDERHLNADLIDFQRARVRYNLCKRLVQKDWRGLLEGIVGLANKAPIHQFN